VVQGHLILEASLSHSDTLHALGILWSSDWPDAETCTWQHTTLAGDRHPHPGGIRTNNPSHQAAADPRLRPGGHWDRTSATNTLRPSLVPNFSLLKVNFKT
jgi:hypothetical protein